MDIKIIIAIITIVTIIAICTLAFRGQDVDEVSSNTVENIANIEENENENEVNNELDNDSIENTIENTMIAQNVVENQKLDTKDFSSSVYEDKTEAGTLGKKQEAINLVTEQWGQDDSVTFSCDSITSDGIYIIAVTSKERAVVLNYFRVNLATKTVTVDY